jgi:hypothetical protein
MKTWPDRRPLALNGWIALLIGLVLVVGGLALAISGQGSFKAKTRLQAELEQLDHELWQRGQKRQRVASQLEETKRRHAQDMERKRRSLEQRRADAVTDEADERHLAAIDREIDQVDEALAQHSEAFAEEQAQIVQEQAQDQERLETRRRDLEARAQAGMPAGLA